MIRRSLAFALRSFGQTPSMAFPMMLRPIPLRAFAYQGNRRYNEESQGEESGNSPRQNRGPRQLDPNRDRTFRAAVFEGMTKLSSSEVLEFLYKHKGNDTTENFMLAFFDSLNTKDGFAAWGALAPEQREQFIKNYLLLVEESLAVQSRFPIGIFTKTLLRLIISKGDVKMAQDLVTSLTNLIRSNNARFSVVAAFLSSLANRRVLRSSNFYDLSKICEQVINDQIHDIKTKGEGRNWDSVNANLTNYLNLCVEGFPFNRSEIQNVINYLLGIQLNEIPANIILDAYIYMGALSLQRIPIVTNHQTNVEFMNYCINKHLAQEPRAPKEGEPEGQPQQQVWSVQPIVAGKQLTPDQIFAFVQAFIIENNQGIHQLHRYAAKLADNIDFGSISPQFRRFMNKHVSSLDLEKLDNNTLKSITVIASRFLTGPRSQKLKMQIMKLMSDKLITYKDVNYLTSILPIFASFKNMLIKSEKTGEASLGNIFGEELTAEEQQVIRNLFKQVSDILLSDEYPVSTFMAVPIIRTLVGTYGILTIDELKAKRIHRELWDKLVKKNRLGNFSTQVLSTLNIYDLPNDNDMQKIMIEILDKDDFKFKDVKTGEFKGSKYPRVLEEIHSRFLNKKGELVGESLVVLERLDKIKGESKRTE